MRVRGYVKVRVSPNRLGHLTISPINDRITRRIVKVVKANGGPGHDSVYLQVDTDVEAFLADFRPSVRRDVDAGWDVTVIMDPWVLGHYFGYDGHTAFERRAA